MRKFTIEMGPESGFMDFREWGSEYFEDNRQAAKYLIEVLKPYSSIDFLWCLREEAARELEDQNEEFGTNWPLDRAPEGFKVSFNKS